MLMVVVVVVVIVSLWTDDKTNNPTRLLYDNTKETRLHRHSSGDINLIF